MKKILSGGVLLLLSLCLVLSGCAAHGKTMITAGKTDISVNVFALYLSRMKGDLGRAGLDSAAWQNEANNSWFSTFTELVVEYMLQQRTKDYLSQVTLKDNLANSTDITKVEPNYYY